MGEQDERDEPPLRLANRRFAPGHRRIGHREKGVPNRINRDVKAWLLDAADAIGSDGHGTGGGRGFVERCGRERAEALLTALLRLLPAVKPAEPVAPAASPLFVSVCIESVPSGRFLTDDAIDALRPDKPQPLLVVDNDDDTPPAA